MYFSLDKNAFLLQQMIWLALICEMTYKQL